MTCFSGGPENFEHLSSLRFILVPSGPLNFANARTGSILKENGIFKTRKQAVVVVETPWLQIYLKTWWSLKKFE